MKLAALILALPMLAHAQFYTGNRLLSGLSGDENQQISALAYIQGVADAGNGSAFCPPGSVTTGQIADIVAKVIREMPADRHNPAAWFITGSLQGVWPCQKGRSL